MPGNGLTTILIAQRSWRATLGRPGTHGIVVLAALVAWRVAPLKVGSSSEGDDAASGSTRRSMHLVESLTQKGKCRVLNLNHLVDGRDESDGVERRIGASAST
jgi:hypothetical protein